MTVSASGAFGRVPKHLRDAQGKGTDKVDLIDQTRDALDRALPEEAAGFYPEALALALNPRIAPAVRERIEARAEHHNQGAHHPDRVGDLEAGPTAPLLHDPS